MSDDNITKLPVKFRTPPGDGRVLSHPWEVKRPGSCFHDSFVVDEKLDTVECARCGERLNPMWVLSYLASQDRQFHDTRKLANDAMARLESRSRTKCDHCGKMTRIKRV